MTAPLPIQDNITLAFCWTHDSPTAPEEGVSRLRESGFEGVELWPEPLEKYGVQRWARALADNGMRCSQLCPYFDFVSGLEKMEHSRRILTDYVAFAGSLSCGKLRVFTGPTWGGGVVGARDATEEQWQSAVDGLREFCDFAPHIEFCLECHEGSLMEDSPSTLKLIRGVNRSNLTVNLQLPLCGEEWGESISALGPHATHMHIHNWTQGFGRGEWTFLCEGAFDWTPVVSRLGEWGRSICLSVEHADHNGRHNPWETARRDGPFLRQLRKSCGDRSAPRPAHGIR